MSTVWQLTNQGWLKATQMMPVSRHSGWRGESWCYWMAVFSGSCVIVPESGRKQLLRELYTGRSPQNEEFGLPVLLVASPRLWFTNSRHGKGVWIVSAVIRIASCCTLASPVVAMFSLVPNSSWLCYTHCWTNVPRFDWCPYQVAGSVSCGSCYFIWHLAKAHVCTLWPVSYSGHRLKGRYSCLK